MMGEKFETMTTWYTVDKMEKQCHKQMYSYCNQLSNGGGGG